jgi:hypothetical protein
MAGVIAFFAGCEGDSDPPSSECGACPSGTTCDPMIGCVSGRACGARVDCADEDPCTTDERCNSAVRTCVYDVLDGDGDGLPPPICGGTDCDDSNGVVGGSEERCDGFDNDCDGRTDEGGALCGSAGTCSDGFCECTDPVMRDCGLGCIDVRTDEEHCGDCFRTCEGGACVAGVCECGSLTDCGAGCVDTSSDPANCGRCGDGCGAFACVEGRCVCGEAGEACCGGDACAGGTICSDGMCVACGGAGDACCEGGTCGEGSECIADGCVACGTFDTPCCGGTTCAEGVCIEGTCEDVPCLDDYPEWPATAFPRCTATTLSCAMGCTTRSCLETCLAGDTTAPSMGFDCADCYTQQTRYCADRSGCHDQLSALRCCEDANCPPGSAADCSRTMCRLENDAFNTCASGTACRRFESPDLRRCFP